MGCMNSKKVYSEGQSKSMSTKSMSSGCEQGVFACLVMIILENLNCQRQREPLNGAVKSYEKYLFKFENLYILNVL